MVKIAGPLLPLPFTALTWSTVKCKKSLFISLVLKNFSISITKPK